MLASEFNGIFLDTLDDPAAYRGMAAAAALVGSLGQAFPWIHIM
jgi:hypothetical protein